MQIIGREAGFTGSRYGGGGRVRGSRGGGGGGGVGGGTGSRGGGGGGEVGGGNRGDRNIETKKTEKPKVMEARKKM